jgi:hypothetical protein
VSPEELQRTVVGSPVHRQDFVHDVKRQPGEHVTETLALVEGEEDEGDARPGQRDA